ncbi:hypothetical protein RRG08_035899 [Elysia crispata]|uniref:Uncharacterized protein n=1 Tax=Elysia crispata TaxID=231223 RepID=A0AAE1DQX2_9GAST|nr:hypothetical protein RRG08_035899 [Elysia crispata]
MEHRLLREHGPELDITRAGPEKYGLQGQLACKTKDECEKEGERPKQDSSLSSTKAQGATTLSRIVIKGRLLSNKS